MSSPSYAIVFSARTSGAGASGAAGDVLIPDTGTGLYVLATTAARGTRRAHGVALHAYSASGSVEIQQCGTVDATVTGLGAGSASWVRVSTGGSLERVSMPSASDDVVGWAEADGTLHASFGNGGPMLTGDVLPEWYGAKGDGTTDDTTAIQAAIAAVATTGGRVRFGPKTYIISATLRWATRAVTLVGSGPKWGTYLSPPFGTNIKWNGATGTTLSPVRMIEVTSGGHYATVQDLSLDANDKADTCLAFLTTGVATPHQVHRPTVRRMQFNGYRGPALVFGNPDTTVFDTGQLQMATAEQLTFGGGGATATVANVFAIILNAQNCEILSIRDLYCDPFTVPNGGPYVNHQSHIKVRTGGLRLDGATFTRSNSYNIDVVSSECGLVVSHVRTEDAFFVRTAAGFPGNPIAIREVQGRDGVTTGSDSFIYIAAGGGQAIAIENIHSTGHVEVTAADNHQVFIRGISLEFPGVSLVRVNGGLPYAGTMSLEATPGVKTIYNALAEESWYDASGGSLVRTYHNAQGKIRIKSLNAIDSGTSDGANLGGIVTITHGSTTGTVTFATAEPDASYRILLSPLAQTSTPAAGSNRPTSNMTRTTAGFTFDVETDPGGAATVTFAWLLFRT